MLGFDVDLEVSFMAKLFPTMITGNTFGSVALHVIPQLFGICQHGITQMAPLTLVGMRFVVVLQTLEVPEILVTLLAIKRLGFIVFLQHVRDEHLANLELLFAHPTLPDLARPAVILLLVLVQRLDGPADDGALGTREVILEDDQPVGVPPVRVVRLDVIVKRGLGKEVRTEGTGEFGVEVDEVTVDVLADFGGAGDLLVAKIAEL